jgi:glycosyltransferase involved in cell wall biosynthesis
LYFSQAKAIVTVADLLKQGMVNLYKVNPDKIFVIPNGADIHLFYPRADTSNFRKKLGLDEKEFIITYAGSFYTHHFLEILPYTARIIASEKKHIRFLLIGRGATFNKLKQEISRIDVNEFFTLIGEVDHEKVAEYLASSDICVYVLYNTYNNYFGFSPIKLYEYMASGKPVAVASNMDEIVDFVNSKKIGLAIKLSGNIQEDSQKFSKVILSLFDKETRNKAGHHGRKLAEQIYNWDVSVKRLDRLLKSVCHAV